ncbi:MAG: hypothetical protein M1823_006479, partial [Watsoniomyces obsoletus]
IPHRAQRRRRAAHLSRMVRRVRDRQADRRRARLHRWQVRPLLRRADRATASAGPSGVADGACV